MIIFTEYLYLTYHFMGIFIRLPSFLQCLLFNGIQSIQILINNLFSVLCKGIRVINQGMEYMLPQILFSKAVVSIIIHLHDTLY